MASNGELLPRKSTDETREDLFVLEYLTDLDPRRAARAIGLTGGHAGYAFLARPRVKQKITTALAERRASLNLEVGRVLEVLAHLAFRDGSAIFDEHGVVKPVDQWDDFNKEAIVGAKYDAQGQIQIIMEKKGENVERLMKYFKLFEAGAARGDDQLGELIREFREHHRRAMEEDAT